MFDNVLGADIPDLFPVESPQLLRHLDFVAERLDGAVLPVEVQFRKRIDAADLDGLRHFMQKFASPSGVVVTRDSSRWDAEERILYIPLQSFLSAS